MQTAPQNADAKHLYFTDTVQQIQIEQQAADAAQFHNLRVQTEI
ncbi:hypothetical protein [Methanolapillus africanus]